MIRSMESPVRSERKLKHFSPQALQFLVSVRTSLSSEARIVNRLYLHDLTSARQTPRPYRLSVSSQHVMLDPQSDTE